MTTHNINLSKNAAIYLKTRINVDKNYGECCICLDDMDINNIIYQCQNCKNVFHYCCIKVYIETNRDEKYFHCPMCMFEYRKTYIKSHRKSFLYKINKLFI